MLRGEKEVFFLVLYNPPYKQGGIGFLNRDGLTRPSPVATVGPVGPNRHQRPGCTSIWLPALISPSRQASCRYDGSSPSPAPGGIESIPNCGKGKVRATRLFNPRFFGIRHDSEEQATFKIQPMAGLSSPRGLGRRRVQGGGGGVLITNNWLDHNHQHCCNPCRILFGDWLVALDPELSDQNMSV